VLFAFEAEEIGFSSSFRAAERDVVDAVVLQIAEGRRVALFARKEVFVDPQDLSAYRGMVLAHSPMEVMQEVSWHGRSSDALAAAEPAAVDPIQVLLINHLLEALAGSLPRLHSRHALAKESPAIQAAALAHRQIQDSAPETPVIMAHPAATPALVA